ncbi:AI-2E family transporter [Ornithinimicrobium ciconiae]|uniref:AI-2E family transporter n=1 Tax=Ornithinimicrobium ciconiae TaxID=2594265 RepID=A0A516GAS7_9MICO|nr:AI-2E family transporter [Ornithinimicrobium ciconiae]QDO88602.1 AI-2E family transporter [Ornithinimicrobium ciconiae]
MGERAREAARPTGRPSSQPGTEATSPQTTAETTNPQTTLLLDRANVWRVAWTVVAVFLLVRLLLFVQRDGGSILGMVILAWAASLALEPAVSRLARHMKRGWATLVVLVTLAGAAALFLYLFGGMLAEQLRTFVESLPSYVDSLNSMLSEYLDTDALLKRVGEPLDFGAVATSVAGGVFSVVATLLGSLFSVFTFAFFVFYLTADGPRLRSWLARLFPPGQQEVFTTVWDLAIAKTGGYVAARVVLAACSAVATSLFLLVIDMPYWLPLGIWTGVVAAFVPTIGTYIAVALPVLVGLVGENPAQGLFVLIFATVYQQVENLLLEPRISARAVEVHPAIAFGSVMLGAALFGVAGAFVAVPAAALGVALLEIYTRKYEVVEDGDTTAEGDTAGKDVSA